MFMIGYLYNRDLGFNILLPDLQHQGESEGRAIQMGWKDRLDVLQWMNITNKYLWRQHADGSAWYFDGRRNHNDGIR